MRRILLSLLLVLPCWLSAAVYYVSPTGSDTNNGTSQSTPWKTIARVNQIGTSITAGTQILFQRGGTYRGRLNINGSGTSSNKIIIGAYGSGAAPIISGSELVTGWTLHSGNIWKASVASNVKQVYFNGNRMELARFPNEGWMRTDIANSTSTTDATLTQGSGYFTGATMVIRTTNWSYDTAFVSTHSGTTLTHTSTGNNLGAQQWGYFLRNKLSLLDQAGEWYYNRANGTLYVWCPNNAAPASNTIEAAVQDFGVYFGYQRHDARVSDLTFQHQTDASVRLSVTYNIEVANCTMQDTYRAIYSTGSSQQFHHLTITRTYLTAVYLLDNNSSFTFNSITDVCLWPGWGENNWGYFGLRTNGTGMVITDNYMENIGYIGIAAYANAQVERNVVHHALAILNDGGGIAIDNADGMVLRRNIVRDMVGEFESVAPESINKKPMAHGIYFGNISIKNTTVEWNTVANCSVSGIHVDHTMVSSGNQVRNNTLFNNGEVQLSISDYSNYNTPGASAPFYVPSFNTVYSGNIMYCLSKDQECMLQTHVNSATLVDFGSFSGNRYFNPYNELSIQVHNTTAGTREFFSMERWAQQFSEDAGSTRHPLRQDVYSTVSELSGNLVVNGDFNSNVTGWAGFPYNAVVTRDMTYLDNGALKAYLPNASQYATFSLRNPDYFNMQNGQWYRLRFSLQSNIMGNLNAGIKGASQLVTYTTIWERDLPFDNQRRDIEWYFPCGLTDQAMVQFINSYTQPQYWIDNIQLHRVTVAPIDPAQQHLLYTNEQPTAQTFTLPSGCWKDVEGVLQGQTISVQPYESKIVYRVTGTGCSVSQPDCQGVAGGSALPGTACNDNNACTVNDVWTSDCLCQGTPNGITAAISATGPTSFCSGSSVVLNASSGTGYLYVWKRNGAVISGATSASYTASQGGTYTVEITSGGCSATSQAVVVSVGSLPSANVTAGGATSFCAGGSVTLSASTGSGYTYQWLKNGTNLSGATSSTYTATTAGSYAVVVNSSGCSATSSALTVTVNASPTASITAGGATGFCTGGSVTLSAATGSGYGYQWRRDGANISGATASTYTATLAGTYTVQTTANGCSSVSSGIPVTVGTTPAATVSASGATTFCSGNSVTLSVGTGTGYTYQWRRNGTNVSGATANTYSATATGSYSVVVSNGGCTATSGNTSVTVNASPTATVTAGGATSFCTGGSVTLNASTCTGCGYQWRRNGTTLSGATSSSYSATTTGSYTVTVTRSGCSTTSSATSVSVSSVPTASISASGSTTFCTGGGVQLNATTGAGLTYQWRLNGSSISGATSSSYMATGAGAYSVVIANGACSTTSASTTVTVLPTPNVSCSANNSNGTVSVTATGGQAPYTYAWSTSPVQTTATATVTASGSYNVNVTGANGCVSVCSTTITVGAAGCSGIRTESQGVWGAPFNGSNPSSYLNTQWAAAFPAPNYLTIGCGSRLMRFTTAQAVVNALPSSGTAALLPAGTTVNPTSISNTLIGHLTALKISARVDEVDPAFSVSPVLLKNMVVTSGTFGGWTVQQLLDHADLAIGGCVSQYPLVTIASALANINQGYQAGLLNNGYLTCPSGAGAIALDSQSWEDVGKPEIMAYPNPMTESTTLQLSGLAAHAQLVVEVRDAHGALVETVANGVVPEDGVARVMWMCSGRAAGIYYCRVIAGEDVLTQKLIVER
ncbi:MAG: T9SS type A sorting domain-containing protein [Flavobacteriales bacterium]|nr:T9SS type A sorting domain-containing protein [Flavobacteriales bacterium]